MRGLVLGMKFFFFAIMILLNLPVAALADTELPVENGVVTSGVGWRVDPFGSRKAVFHRGIDIAVPVGTPVRAVRKGKVVFAGAHGGYGQTVIVEHVNGDRTLYGHNSSLLVHPGELIASGATLAYSGNTGRSTGPHVHFEELPSGRPSSSTTETVEASVTHPAYLEDQRYMLENRMEESMKSILNQIHTGGLTGQGG